MLLVTCTLLETDTVNIKFTQNDNTVSKVTFRNINYEKD